MRNPAGDRDGHDGAAVPRQPLSARRVTRPSTAARSTCPRSCTTCGISGYRNLTDDAPSGPGRGLREVPQGTHTTSRSSSSPRSSTRTTSATWRINAHRGQGAGPTRTMSIRRPARRCSTRPARAETSTLSCETTARRCRRTTPSRSRARRRHAGLRHAVTFRANMSARTGPTTMAAVTAGRTAVSPKWWTRRSGRTRRPARIGPGGEHAGGLHQRPRRHGLGAQARTQIGPLRGVGARSFHHESVKGQIPGARSTTRIWSPTVWTCFRHCATTRN